MSNKLIKEKRHEDKEYMSLSSHIAVVLCLIAVVVTVAAIVTNISVSYSNDNVTTSSINNPYEEGTVLHAAYELHNKDVTGTMEMSDLEDGTKVYYVLYEDNWTAYIYMHLDGTNSGKVENIP